MGYIDGLWFRQGEAIYKRKFNNKTYLLGSYDMRLTKKEANARAKRYRFHGHNARVIQFADGYTVYRSRQ